MVAPFDVHIVKAHQFVHHQIGMRSAVEDIADDMEHVDAALADQAADGDDEFFRHARAGDGVDDLTVILLFGVLRVRMEQFVDDIGEGFRHLFADLGAGVFGGNRFAYLYQAVNGDFTPFAVGIVPCILLGEHLLRGVYQIGELFPLAQAHRFLEQPFDFIPGDAGGAV